MNRADPRQHQEMEEFHWVQFTMFMGMVGLVIMAYSYIGNHYVHRQPWMDTYNLPASEKGIGIIETETGQRLVLVPTYCIGMDLHVYENCIDRSIDLPIIR